MLTQTFHEHRYNTYFGEAPHFSECERANPTFPAQAVNIFGLLKPPCNHCKAVMILIPLHGQYIEDSEQD
jgi:hypothetical protein